jgi:hypothetical protein
MHSKGLFNQLVHVSIKVLAMNVQGLLALDNLSAEELHLSVDAPVVVCAGLLLVQQDIIHDLSIFHHTDFCRHGDES